MSTGEESESEDDSSARATLRPNKRLQQTAELWNARFARSISRRGASFALLEQLAADDFEVSVSVPLVLEYEAVVRRQSRELGLTHDEIDTVLDFLCRVAHHRQIFFLWRPFLRDPNDDMVLEVAVEAGCTHIITFNLRDFVGIEQFGLSAITPAQFLTLLGAPS